MTKKRKLTEEHKKKISEARKKQEALKKLALEEFQAENKAPSKGSISRTVAKDARYAPYLNLNPMTVRGILDSTYDGRLDRWMELCDEIIASDPHIAGLVETRTMAVAGADWYIEPYDESSEAKKAAEDLRSRFEALQNQAKVFEGLLWGIFAGVSFAEVDWTVTEDGETVFTRIVPKHGKKFLYDSDFEPCIYDVDSPHHEKKLASFGPKFLVHTPGKLNRYYPTRAGLLRSLALFWLFKKEGVTCWLKGAAKYAYPSIYALFPEDTDEEVVEALVQSLRRFSSDSVAVFESGIEINTLDQSSVSGGDSVWSNLVKLFDSQATKLITGGTLTVDAGSKGSYALGEVHERTRTDISIADAEALAETFRNQLFRPYFQLNKHRYGGKIPPLPRLWFDIREYPQIQPWHTELGIITKNQVLESLGLPRIPGPAGNEIVVPPQVPSVQPSLVEASEGTSPKPRAPLMGQRRENGEIFLHWMKSQKD